MATDLSLKSPTMKIVAWVSVLLCWCGWVIALSGLSALQHDCGRAQLYKTWGNIGELGPVRCDKLFAYWWWKVWYEWGVLIAVCLALGIGRVHIFRVALAVGLGIATVLLMDATNTSYFGWYSLTSGGKEKTRGRVFFAGTLITSVFNFLLIAVLGTHDESADVADDYGGRKDTGARTTGTGAGAATSQAAQAV